jgi:hypothetical protein
MEEANQMELEEITEGHVFYRFLDQEIYISNLISFIKSGIENKQQILIIENMRYLPKVREMIHMLVSEENQSAIRIVNNFEYYLSKGDFNTQNIVTHFQNDISALENSKSSIRTWAHVEWASSDPDAELLHEFESVADDFVIKERMLSVCAYSGALLTPNLSTALEQLHYYVMTDDTFSISPTYNQRLLDTANNSNI